MSTFLVKFSTPIPQLDEHYGAYANNANTVENYLYKSWFNSKLDNFMYNNYKKLFEYYGHEEGENSEETIYQYLVNGCSLSVVECNEEDIKELKIVYNENYGRDK